MTDIKTKALPSVDVPTWWNSTYLMIDSSLPYKEAFINLSMSDANYTSCPTTDEWDELETMRDFLHLFNLGERNSQILIYLFVL